MSTFENFKPRRYRRITRTERTGQAGCWECSGLSPMWEEANAFGMAAKHHDRTGHDTWVVGRIFVRYGDGAESNDFRPSEELNWIRGSK